MNEGARPVFILDGEELVGAKQNRIVNLSVMIPAKAETLIPVSCVEQGRWGYRSREFTDSPNTMYAAARAEKTRRVNDSMKRGSRDADQGAVWASVAAKASSMDTVSATGAMKDVYDRHHRTLIDYELPFGALEGQTGAVFAIDDVVLGFDLFDAHSTLRAYLPKIVRGYALDAIERTRAAASGPESARLVSDAAHLLETVAHAHTKSYRAVGLGTDVRVELPGIAGAALSVENEAVHVSAFRASSAGGRSSRHDHG